MSRRPQMRGANDGPAPAPRDDARRAWLSHWKEWAIERVPVSASAITRSRVRLEVERALARLGAQDPENEVQDMVQAVLDPILQELAVPPPRQWGRRLATGTFVTTVAAAKVLEQNPQLRELVKKGLAAGQEKLRAALARVTAARKPPTS